MVEHLNGHPVCPLFDTKLIKGSMHNVNENGLFGRTSHFHIYSIGGRILGSSFLGLCFQVLVFMSEKNWLGIT